MRQVEGLRYKVPEIVGVTIAFITLIILLLGIVVYSVRRRSYSIKSQRNSLDVSHFFPSFIKIHARSFQIKFCPINNNSVLKSYT